MSALAEKTRIYQAALEYRRKHDEHVPYVDRDEVEVDGAVAQAQAEMEIAWLEATHAGP